MDGSELADIGLSANDVDDLHAAWVSNMKTVVTGEKPVLFVRLYVKMIILPRQARDKHWENAKKSARRFLAAIISKGGFAWQFFNGGTT